MAKVLLHCLWEMCNREEIALDVRISLGREVSCYSGSTLKSIPLTPEEAVPEREKLDLCQWTCKKYHLLPLLDRGLRKIGLEAY